MGVVLMIAQTQSWKGILVARPPNVWWRVPFFESAAVAWGQTGEISSMRQMGPPI